jgi:hypothetical protein
MRAVELLPKDITVYVDMDGVLADLFNYAGEINNVEHYNQMTQDQWEAFFKDSNGEQLEQSTEYTAGGFQQIIPSDTTLECIIVGASWEPETQYRNKIVKVMLMVEEKGKYNG